MANEKKQLIKRKEIVDAVLKLMEKSEFETLSVRKICDAADISVGTFYHYFNEKNELITAILSDLDEYLIDHIKDKLNYDDELKKLKEFGRIVMRKVVTNGYVLSRLISSTPLPSTPEGRKEEFNRLVFSIPLKIIERGQEKDQIVTEMSAKEITGMFIMLLRGIIVDWSRREGNYNIENEFELCFKYFERGIRSK